ncbi:MAG: flagellin [Phycisphaerales bacterium]|nr:flagellin [Phycisphaerales bacterium]
MSRINTNVSSMIGQVNLARSQGDLQVHLQRLSTGLRINRGADDPAGLIVSERLRSELSGIGQGVKNSERASNVISTTEGALSEVSEMLNGLKALVVEAANTGAFSKEEIAANQLQIDSAIESITRIANTTTFAGLKLLNGSLGYKLSGVNGAHIVKSQVFGAQFGDRPNVKMDVEVIGSAQTANLYFNTNFTGVGQTAGVLPSSVTLQIAGPKGVIELTFTTGTTINQIRDAINARSSVTGIAAARQNAGNPSSGLVFSSQEYGSEAFVSVRRISGGSTFTFARIQNNAPGPINWGNPAQWTAADRDEGQDVRVLLNGAVATGRGLNVTFRNPELDISLQLAAGFADRISSGPSTFYITGGGSKFQLGPQVNASQQVDIGIDSIAATQLGGTQVPDGSGNLILQFLSSLKSGGANALDKGNLQNASAILETAIDEISQLRGRLGAFEKNVLQTNVRSLQAGLENITAAESVIRDADFARETSSLTRSQILVSAGTSALAAANSSAQSVLQLLG